MNLQIVTEIFKSLSDPIRLRLITLLAIQGEVCVCDLAKALAEPDYKISRHLKTLRASGLVTVRRRGSWMHYKLSLSGNPWKKFLRDGYRDYLGPHPVIREDLQRLEATRREGDRLCPVDEAR